MKNYLNALTKIARNGWDESWESQDVRTLVGGQLTFDLTKGYPILTSRKIDFDNVIKDAFICWSQLDTEQLVQELNTRESGRIAIKIHSGERDLQIDLICNGSSIHASVYIDNVDFVCELPHLISVTALLVTLLLAGTGSNATAGKSAGTMVVSLGRTYFRRKCVDAILEQINRPTYKLPRVVVAESDTVNEDNVIKPENVLLSGYVHGPTIIYR